MGHAIKCTEVQVCQKISFSMNSDIGTHMLKLRARCNWNDTYSESPCQQHVRGCPAVLLRNCAYMSVLMRVEHTTGWGEKPKARERELMSFRQPHHLCSEAVIEIALSLPNQRLHSCNAYEMLDSLALEVAHPEVANFAQPDSCLETSVGRSVGMRCVIIPTASH